VIHLCLGLPDYLCLQAYPPKSCEHFFSLHAFHMLRRAHLPWFGQPNTIRRRLQIMKLLVKQFRLVFCYFLHLRTKYLSLHLFSTPSAHVLHLLCDIKFHAHVKQRSKSVMYISIPKFSVSKSNGTRFWSTRQRYRSPTLFCSQFFR